MEIFIPSGPGIREQSDKNDNLKVNNPKSLDHVALKKMINKLSPGEKRILQSNVNKIAIIDSEYRGQKTGGKSIQFTVTYPKEPQAEKLLPRESKRLKA